MARATGRRGVDTPMKSITLAPSNWRLDHASRIPSTSRSPAPRASRVRRMSSATSRGPTESQPTRLRVALFGAGLVGQAGHAPSLWDEHDRFEFVAVADPSASVRTAVAARYG